MAFICGQFARSVVFYRRRPKRPTAPHAGPVATSQSDREPHSAHEPS